MVWIVHQIFVRFFFLLIWPSISPASDNRHPSGAWHNNNNQHCNEKREINPSQHDTDARESSPCGELRAEKRKGGQEAGRQEKPDALHHQSHMRRIRGGAHGASGQELDAHQHAGNEEPDQSQTHDVEPQIKFFCVRRKVNIYIYIYIVAVKIRRLLQHILRIEFLSMYDEGKHPRVPPQMNSPTESTMQNNPMYTFRVAHEYIIYIYIYHNTYTYTPYYIYIMCEGMCVDQSGLPSTTGRKGATAPALRKARILTSFRAGVMPIHWKSPKGTRANPTISSRKPYIFSVLSFLRKKVWVKLPAYCQL